MNEAEEIVRLWLEIAEYDRWIFLPYLNLTELPDNFPYDKVEYFSCGGNQLTSLDLPSVIYLMCDLNNIVSLNLPKARHVSCIGNRIESLYLPEVSTLFCGRNPVRQINAPKCEYLVDSPSPYAFMSRSFFRVCHIHYIYNFKNNLKKRIHLKRIQTIKDLNLFDEIGLNHYVEQYMSSSFVK